MRCQIVLRSDLRDVHHRPAQTARVAPAAAVAEEDRIVASSDRILTGNPSCSLFGQRNWVLRGIENEIGGVLQVTHLQLS